MPASAKMKAIQSIQMCDRATEEQLQNEVDIVCSTAHFTEQHNLLDSSLRSATDISTRSLILNKIVDLEKLMIELWRVSMKYCAGLPQLTDFILTEQCICVNECTETNDVTDCDDEFCSDIDSYCLDSNDEEN